MRVKMTIGSDTFEFSGFRLCNLLEVLDQWLIAIGKGQPAADALAEKLETQNAGLADAVAANTPHQQP